jgi:hypothetical protein
VSVLQTSVRTNPFSGSVSDWVAVVESLFWPVLQAIRNKVDKASKIDFFMAVLFVVT